MAYTWPATRYKLCSLIKKTQSTTINQDDQLKETCYAKSIKMKQIRAKMVATISGLEGNLGQGTHCGLDRRGDWEWGVVHFPHEGLLHSLGKVIKNPKLMWQLWWSGIIMMSRMWVPTWLGVVGLVAGSNVVVEESKCGEIAKSNSLLLLFKLIHNSYSEFLNRDEIISYDW